MNPRPGKKSVKPDVSTGLFEALKFVAVAQKADGHPYECHVSLSRNWATTFNGVIAVGAPIIEPIETCPHTFKLIDAISRAGDEYALIQIDKERLCVQTPKFKAFIPCLGAELFAPVRPDPPVADIDNRLVKGFSAVLLDAYEKETRIFAESLLLRSGSVVGTDAVVALEYWHGIDLPTVILPTAAAKAIIKTKKQLARFGFSRTSATFYFDDDTWLRTQLFVEQWPDIDSVLDRPSNQWPIPPDFFEGLRAVLPHLGDDNSFVFFESNKLRSHETEYAGASFQVTGLPAGPAFNGRRLIELESLIKKVDFLAGENNDAAAFTGDNVRGVMIGMRKA